MSFLCVLCASAVNSDGVATAETPPPMRGFSEAGARKQREWEDAMRAIPDAKLLREYMREIASEPHHVGSARGRAVAEWIRDKFRAFGLEASIEEYRVLFPTPKERRVELVAPERYVCKLAEPAIAEDPDSSDEGQLPTYNAYSADGDVTAQLVYVNYGVPADYETLRKLGVDVRGKIVLARYGGSWRGIKPKVAFEQGAVGCLIYSDPRDDGYFQGQPYPDGALRPEHGVQRGSVADMPIYPGDPLTPGVGATADARRLPLAQAATLTRIPVLPLSWGDALPLLRALRGPVAPEAWRGSLPTTYHVGPGPAEVRVQVASSWDMVPACNVIARIPGSTFPDEWIVRGNHHDAWVNGAADPTSGMAVVLEEARAFGELLRRGWRPKRTIVLAAWDAEEPGLLGSTEWVEHHAAELAEKAVAYINGDSNSRGYLSAGGSHSLERFVREVARDVADPITGKSVYDVLRERRLELAADDAARQELRERADLRIAALGSGSDYAPFVDHLGVASLNLSFGEGAFGGVYHSIYDSFAWYTRFSDTTFAYGRALAQVGGTAVMRLAGASVLPFEFGNLADTIGVYAAELRKLVAASGVDLRPLVEAQQRLARSAAGYEAAYRKAASRGRLDADVARLRALNGILYRTERALLSAAGLPKRPWYRHQVYAPGLYTGYGVKTLPHVREALETHDWDEARRGVEVVRGRLAALAGEIDRAAGLLR